MDVFESLLKLILDEKSLANIKSKVNKELKVKVGTDSSKVKAEVNKLASELSRLSKVNTMQSWYDNNTKATKQMRAEVAKLIAEMGNLDKKLTVDESAKITSRFKEIQYQARATGRIGKSAADKFKTAWEKFGGWGIATGAFMKLKTEVVDGIKFIGKLDDALTDVTYTSNISKAGLEELGNSSIKMAKDLNASAENVLEAVKIYSTAKASADDILRKAKPAIMLSNISGMSGSESSKTINTALNQFGLEDTEEQLLDITDTLQYVSSQLNYDFTEGIKQITEGIEASGSVAKNAGLNMQEYAAMVGVAVEQTGQSGSTIGNAYKTIFSRITKASEIEGTLGEDISNAEEALRGIGVQVRSANNDFRDMTDIMADIGSKWNELNDVQKAKVGYEVAGIRQLNVLNSLFGSWQSYSDIIADVDERTGTTLENQEKYAQSLKGHLGDISATTQSIWNNVFDTGDFKGALSGLNDLLGLVEKITDKLGTWGTLAAGIGMWQGVKNAGVFKADNLKSWFGGNKNIAQPFANAEQVIWKYNQAIAHNSLTQQGWERILAQSDDGLKRYLSSIKGTTATTTAYTTSLNSNFMGLKNVASAISQYNSLATKGATEQQGLVNVINASNSSLGGYLSGLNGANASLIGYGASLVGATLKTVGLTAASMALNAVMTMGISVAIQAAIAGIAALGKWMDDLIVTDAELSEKIKDIDTKWKELSSTIQNSAKAFQDLKAQADDIIPRYAKLAQGVDKFGNNVSLTDEEFKEFVSLNNQLGQMFPELVTGYDSNGNAILALSGDVDTLTESLYACVEAQRLATAKTIAETMPEILEGDNGIVESVKLYEEQIKRKREALDEWNEYVKHHRDSLYKDGTKIEDRFIEEDVIALAEQLGVEREQIQHLIEYVEDDEYSGHFNADKVFDSNVMKNAVAGYEKAIDDIQKRIESKWKQLNPVISAWLSTDFLYQDMDTEGQNIVSKLIGELDFKALGLKTSEDVQNYISNNIISPIYDMDADAQKAFFEIFDIQEAVKKGEMTVDEFDKKLIEILSKGNFSEEFKNLFKEAFGDVEKYVQSSTFHDKMTDSLKSLNESLDKIQSAYQAVESAIEEYNKEGYLSVDTFQSLIGLEPQYLNMLLDENGNLNLNTDAVNENTRAYLQNLGIKSAEAMLDTLTTYSSEAEQLDYLSGALNTNTQETWANVYAKLEQLKVDGKITDAVYNSAHARLDAYKKMTDDAIDGIGKGGLGKSASDTSEALDALKYKFDQLEQSIEKVDNAMSLLDTTLDLQAEDDYVGKLETVTRQLDLAQQKSALLRDEFAQLSSTQYSTADEANELATRMKSVADSIAENTKNIIGYGRSISEYYMSALSSIGSLSSNTIERATSLFERNVKTLSEGGLTGLQFTLSPTVPQSAFEKQRQENRAIEEEMRSYYDTLAAMQKTALDMQYQETVADNERKKQELKSTNDATSQEQVQDDKEKLAEQESFISSMKDNIVGLNDWMIENPIKAPELDDSWQQRVEEAKKYAQWIKDAFGGDDYSESLGDGKGAEIARTAKQYLGVPYVWGGQSETSGWDCSGFVRNMMAKNGISVIGNTDTQWFGIQGTKVNDLSNLMPGDVLYFSKDGGKSIYHEAIYLGNNKMAHAKGRSYGTVEETISDSYKRRLIGAKRFFAKGTKDFAVYGDNINGVAGENYKPEILINKKTGDMIPIDEPTFVDTNEYDVVGEKTTAKVLPRYATGTPTTDPEILSYIKRASEATGVPANIIMAVMDQETGYKWYDSVSDGTAYSHGYMMLYDNGALAGMDAQRKQLAITDKYTNVLEGAKLLASNYQKYGDWQTAITRYNGSGSAANKYGQQVWSRANSQAFIDAANNIDSIASYTESTADNTVAIRKSFDSQFRDFIEGANSISNSESVEDSLMDYIKTNTKISSDSTEKFIEAFEGLNAYKDSMEPYFNEKREEVRNAAGTPEFIALTNAYNKEHSEYIDAILGYSTDMTVAQTKAQYKLTEDAIKKGYEYYNERKNAGASATELMEIITKLGEIEKVAEEYSDAYVQAISAETDFLVSRTERTLNAFENEMSWLDKDLEKAEGDTVKQSEIYSKKNDVSRRAMDAAHQRVLEIRQDEDYADILSTYDVESWFDASGELTSKFYADVEGASSELIPYMNQLAEIVGVCKKEWYENNEAIESNNEAMADLKVEEYIKYQERLVESLDFDASISQSLSTAKEGMYNIFKTLRDEKAEMDKELKANMQIDDWLTEDTRKLLFNLDDYEEQMETINGIQAEAEKLYINYKNELEGLKEDELYKEEEITAEYNRQLEKLQDKLSVAKADLQLAKDKAAFENTRKERDTQIIMGNGVRNVADPERLREAAMKMAESESALGNEVTTSNENQDIRNMEVATGMINQEKAAIQNRIDMINGMTDEERRVFADFLEPLQAYRNRLLALTKTNPYRMITGDNSNDVFMSREYSKLEGYSLTQDHSAAVDEIQNLLDNGYYRQGTAEYEVALRTIDFLKKQHDDKTTSDAHNYGYDLYDPSNSVNWYRYMKMYTDAGYAILSQEYKDTTNDTPVISSEGDVLLSNGSKPNISVEGDATVNSPSPVLSSFLKGYEELDDVYEIKNTLSIDENTASTILERLNVGNISPSVDSFVNLAEMPKVWGNVSYTRGNTDNSINISNLDVTLTQPVRNANDIINGFVDKINSTYATTKNQR